MVIEILKDYYRVKQLCREFVNNEDYEALHHLLFETRKKKNLNLKNHGDIVQFLDWQQAIYTHRHMKDLILAEQMLLKILPNTNNLISETDVGIANSLSLIYLEQKKWKDSLNLFNRCLAAIEQLPVVEDKMLFIRAAYNYALNNFYMEQYSEVIRIGYSLIYYSETSKIIYLNGRINHLIGITFEKMSQFIDAEVHMRKAADIFLVESKQYYYLKSLRALSEIQFKAGKKDEGIINLKIVEEQAVFLAEKDHLLELVDEMKLKYI